MNLNLQLSISILFSIVSKYFIYIYIYEEGILLKCNQVLERGELGVLQKSTNNRGPIEKDQTYTKNQLY